MNRSKINMSKPLKHAALGAALLCLGMTMTWAQPESQGDREAAQRSAEAAREQARERRMQAEMLRAESYARALEASEVEQRAALKAVESARQELARRAEAERAKAREIEAQSAEERREMERKMEREVRAVQRELEQAHANLRRASQEVARVHRDIYRTDPVFVPQVSFGSNRAVIGIIPGASKGEGVRVLGLSPDGPAERAGLQQGDIITGLMGENLGGDTMDSLAILNDALRVVEPGDELNITVLRNGETVETTVIAQERTPLTWQSVSRLSTIPAAPPAPPTPPSPDSRVAPVPPVAPVRPLTIQTIEVPSIDLEQLERELETVRDQLADRNIIIERVSPGIEGQEFDFHFETLSEAGESALAGTSVWFGMRLTRGLSLAALNPDLGSYFDAQQGVLVLSARGDNELQLRSGDIILSIDGQEVLNPADVMRALRAVEVGEVVNLEIKRDRSNSTLEVIIPEDPQLGMHLLREWRFDHRERTSRSRQ
jgi:C-terminal processing protease CtpA/Prc